jgi:protein TonB
MFSNLIESGSHKRDLKRKGSFFLGAFAFYGVLFVAAGIGSIYAYNVRIEDRNDEIVTLMSFARTNEERAEPIVRSAARKPSQQRSGGGRTQIAVVTEVVKNSPHLSDRAVASANARELPANMDYKLGDHNFIPPAGFGGGRGDKPGSSERDTGPIVGDKPGDEGPPRIEKAEPTSTPKQENRRPVSLASSVLTGKATNKPAPPYPPLARTARVQGSVMVQIVVDEVGRVVSSKATSGPPLLREAAERAAYRAHFNPTLLGGLPIKVTGFITYNFVLQ